MKKLSIGLLGMLSLVAVFAIPSVASAAFYSGHTYQSIPNYVCTSGMSNSAWTTPFINSAYNYAVAQGASSADLSAFNNALLFFSGTYSNLYGSVRTSSDSAGSISWSLRTEQGSNQDLVACVGEITVTVTAPPATPTGLTATAGSCGTGTINVSWTAVSGATSYQLRNSAGTIIYNGSNTSYSHTGLSAGSSQSYTVRATNASGSSPYSSSVSATAPSACAATYTVTFNGNGSTGGTMSSQTKTQNVNLTLNSNAFTRTGYSFTGWNTAAGGGGTAYANGGTYSANASVTLYAQWVGTNPNYTLTTSVSPAGGGTISGTGISCPSDCSQSYTSGTSVTLTASPQTGYTFSNWSGACSGTTSSCTVSMTADKDVTANFTADGGGGGGGGGGPTASINAPDCTISSGGSSCTSSVSWSSSNTSSRSVRQNGAQFSTLSSSAGTSRTLSQGSHTFTFYDNGVLLDSDPASASCVSGTTWNGSSCAVVSSNFSIVASAIPNSGTAPLNDVDIRGDISGSATGQIEYKIDCTNNGTYSPSSYTSGTGGFIYDNDVCDYPSVGTYTAKIWARRSGYIATDTTTITVVPTYSLSVNSTGLSARDITASPTTYNGTTPYTKSNITSGTSITLTAPAVSGYSVTWSGTGCSSATASVTTSMTANRTCSANYVVSTSPTGSISASPNPCTISSGSQCTSTISWSFLNTNNVQIYVRSSGAQFGSDSVSPGSKDATWITDAGYWFDLRANSTSNSDGTLLDSVFVEGNYSVPVTYTLTTSVSPAGSGTITSNPAGISCGADCTESYNSGTLVTLTATQVGGYSFSNWSGACAGQGSACTISMDAGKTATANFTAVPPPTVTLTANPTSITSGSASTLTWSSITNADSCTATGAWSGAKAIGGGSESTGNLSSTQTYTLTCNGPGGSTPDSATVTVTPAVVNGACGPGSGVPAPAEPTGASACSAGTYNGSTPSDVPSTWWWTCAGSGSGISPTCSAPNSEFSDLSVTCSVSHPTPALIGQTIVWTATPSGGTSPYTYEWSGTSISAPLPTTNPFSKVYSTIGEKTANVIVTDSTIPVPIQGTCALPSPSVYVYFDPSFEEF